MMFATQMMCVCGYVDIQGGKHRVISSRAAGGARHIIRETKRSGIGFTAKRMFYENRKRAILSLQ